ncbi:hypothetical protein FOPG_04952 [Fusarium oxysporum f. sp. conglutinans race 2 54008]|uniref:Uncharacterized protein n=3 Tax=Fusarium oxysporum TaxID=5507 RepID=A0A2H3SML4_FUSOX|nr:hypothetical protein FOPG_04952 [Fusarium oxysporum f. sp. conglutinans race 2 54008]EXM32696.1 hypothetical protein FOTG_02947 [Fusarium oxysporum f. sp. vasinfectum 25433]SCO77718.1 uncharacterized protein FRV6_01930 [Fusarium oxysporum]
MVAFGWTNLLPVFPQSDRHQTTSQAFAAVNDVLGF